MIGIGRPGRVWAFGMDTGGAAAAAGQGVPPPPPPGSGQVEPPPPYPGPAALPAPAAAGVPVAGEVARLARKRIDALRDLGDDLAAAGARSPASAAIEPDARELQQATEDWLTATGGAGDPARLRQSYSGIDVSWQRLRGRLDAPGAIDEASREDVRRLDQLDGPLRQALGLNDYPARFEGQAAGPADARDQTRRLAYALAERGEALAATIEAIDGPNPALAPLVRDAGELARMADGYHDALGDPAQASQPGFARIGFSRIVRRSNQFGIALTATPMPEPIRAAWDAYTSAHNLLRVDLGLVADTPDGLLPDGPPSNVAAAGLVPTGAVVGVPNPPAVPLPAGVSLPYVAAPAAPVAGWAERLVAQADDLLVHFGPTAGVVPEGRLMLGDMQRLRNQAGEFRRAAAAGVDPGRLANGFREFDETWRRLARRIDRVGRGRTGPNINRVREIGDTAGQIHRVLGMPGIAPY